MENMMQGNKIRRVAATRMNERSSRSHTIFRIIWSRKMPIRKMDLKCDKATKRGEGVYQLSRFEID
ncbi:unnamed protein product [Acanthoscelides obtectus]|uniref:Kinesin motor domain-containing protein n=1 Tax=Acanthoscelides obtectus TaxID=200917 RepID=A0A9P0QDY3_ACAOB|nr:unnamed protein product [Acanthoscelides obtectus]CAK1688232.1 hypothetical protein AOBTE_LOCUS36631 [Acanthoscelides obtectus]